jgi:hypothetical protein
MQAFHPVPGSRKYGGNERGGYSAQLVGTVNQLLWSPAAVPLAVRVFMYPPILLAFFMLSVAQVLYDGHYARLFP